MTFDIRHWARVRDVYLLRSLIRLSIILSLILIMFNMYCVSLYFCVTNLLYNCILHHQFDKFVLRELEILVLYRSAAVNDSEKYFVSYYFVLHGKN